MGILLVLSCFDVRLNSNSSSNSNNRRTDNVGILGVDIQGPNQLLPRLNRRRSSPSLARELLHGRTTVINRRLWRNDRGGAESGVLGSTLFFLLVHEAHLLDHLSSLCPSLGVLDWPWIDWGVLNRSLHL